MSSLIRKTSRGGSGFRSSWVGVVRMRVSIDWGEIWVGKHVHAHRFRLYHTEHLCPDACLDVIEHTAVGKRDLQRVLELIHGAARPRGSEVDPLPRRRALQIEFEFLTRTSTWALYFLKFSEHRLPGGRPRRRVGGSDEEGLRHGGDEQLHRQRAAAG
eukprot:COSAG02_NODE_6978_length_3252_cov_1.909610_2_plen_158_part_00